MQHNEDDTQLYRSPLLSRAEAVELPEATTTLLDAAGVAWHYGNPLGEQRALSTTPVLIDRSHRRVIKVHGPDAPSFLNNLLSQKLDDVAAGFSASALDLDIHGHILHQADIYFDGDAYFLDLPSYQAQSFSTFLHRMVFWSEVTIEDSDLGIITILAPAGHETLTDLGAVFTRGPSTWGRVQRTDIALPRKDLPRAAEEFITAGGALAGLMAFTAERVWAGEPEPRADLDDKSIPHEVESFINRGEHIGAVHLNKGCYRGQETVARVENLGRSPRVMVMLHLDGSAPIEPTPGSEITVGGRRAGRVGTVVHDAEYGPIALAAVKRSALRHTTVTIVGEVEISASIDSDSVPAEEGEKAGRRAVEKLRSNN
ncbi:YgfZ/GcvT domain-containing protein [Corynebacterium mayonis]|uniref:CAF17-like 4Fe-4S cluster assembly/insertion protein YgfZ n=1 Tax=Corynebacterium mayonis TaxID=3062461 RepID=UPI003140135B